MKKNDPLKTSGFAKRKEKTPKKGGEYLSFIKYASNFSITTCDLA
jgi:hypothetical protein